ncbi:YIP1 family protein [Staphylococcus pettenkoferi]|uniref:YIP1 family protein n=2 Tax=Staphylococcus pettenkoferi TaxID=170573 RepID=A0ABT4BNT5_9STAP|nr:YIP1 family protein [Staphylococcus pettenkoferi]MCI2804132.1 YIP1 family protein [Staphylococcus pettenkoferi]MCY1565067.1 YIP1 family protein [Staphylococcus pettenkoferi]MCY1571347.1 YIP1 family protein [Staphylococcus pettenkoferi]MCY1584342.1 YIP1 family protein [Staphylococcus pettenkoferi]MCY1589044.1 YIP1 family protein [Staphylococcus pettenkoferi]
MENSKLPFADHFSKLRENPKWLVKLIAFLIISFFVSWLRFTAIDQTKLLKKNDAGQQAIDAYNQFRWPMIIGGAIGNFILLILIAFLIFLVISKIMKSDVSALSIFCASLSYNIIVYTFVLIVFAIQAIAGIDLGEYNIASLNIFDKGNGFLEAINLQYFLSAYVIGLYYYFTAKLSKKSAVIWAIVALIVLIAIGMMNAGNGM